MVQDRGRFSLLFFIVDSQSVRALIAFCSLLGLADLHTENLVYHQPDPNSKYLPQLIDAEVGMSYALPNDSPLKAAAEQTYGQMVCNVRSDLNSIPRDILNNQTLTKIDPNLLKEFFDVMRKDLSPLSSRFILIGTSALFEARHKYLTINDLNNTNEMNTWRGFYRGLLQDGKSNLER